MPAQDGHRRERQAGADVDAAGDVDRREQVAGVAEAHQRAPAHRRARYELQRAPVAGLFLRVRQGLAALSIEK